VKKPPAQIPPVPKPKGNIEEARNYYNAGNQMALNGKYKEAVEQYKLALQSDPSFADAHRGLGIAYARQKKSDEAVRHYELYLQARPYAQDAARVREILDLYRKSNP
jgi:tetratricopeptide (TPR) repeat protein